MPAQSGDLIGAALQHSISIVKKSNSSDSVDCKLLASAKRVLTSEIKYIKTSGCGNPTLADLKSKYISLGQTAGGPATPVKPTPSPSTSWTSPSKEVKAQELPQPKRVLYPPDAVQLGWKGNVPVGAGFINLGNSCYLNSTLQALFHVPAFVNWLSSDSAHFSKCESMNGLTHSECLICAMAKVLQATHKSTGSAIKPLGIYSKLKAICKHLVHGHQEDAHEFLRYLIEGMERSYLSLFNGIKLDSYSKETTPLNQIFGGYMRTEVACLECHHISTTFQHFQDILLDIRQASTVEEALDGYFSRERLGDGDQAYKCEQCKKRVAATKKFSIERLPKVLCIQLKRFGAMGGKNNKHIALKQCLDITKYRHRPPPANQTFRYKLVSLVTHLGHSSSCGHYTAVGQGSAGSYYLFDDSIVRVLSIPNVLNSNAYILMYELDNNQTPVKDQSVTQTNKLVLESSNLTNGLSNGFSPQPSKTLVNGVSSGSCTTYTQQEKSSPTLERQSPVKVGSAIEKKTALPFLIEVPSPFSRSPSPSNTLLLTPPVARKAPSKTPSPVHFQPTTSRVKSPQAVRGTESLVPYLSGSSDSESGSPLRTTPDTVRPEGPSQQEQPNSPKRKPVVKERDGKPRKNGCLCDTAEREPEKSRSPSTKSDDEPTPSEELERSWEVSSRTDANSPAGSVSSGWWSVTTSSDKEKSPERQEEKKSSSYPSDRERSRERSHQDRDRDKERPWDKDKGNSTVDTLTKMSHRGFGPSVTSWNGSKSELDKEVESDRVSSLKRPLSSYDSDLDRGRVKKVKKYNGHDHAKDKTNKFQEYQNRKNGSSGYRQNNLYRQYSIEKAKFNRNYRWQH
ncbi:ubiquitin carboxyl-terminal hydrolase 36 isoform X2 [Cimex lectularius]|nr:ubiquitin carboxyl-terminal hydrolase 36 isoform X2 [Cimex lectularius]